MAEAAKHLSLTNEQYTPEQILEPVREVLGEIDLDPATSELANQRVGAKQIFTAEDGARTFEEDWRGRVFMNPPGGSKTVLPGAGFGSNPALFWSKLMYEWNAQHVEMAIVVGFTIEVLQTTQCEPEYPMLRFPFCIPRRRVKFDVPREEKLRQAQERLQKVGRNSARGSVLAKQVEVLEASEEEIVSGENPPHGNVIILVPPFSEHYFGDADQHGAPWVTWGGPVVRRFQRAFGRVGYVRV